MEDSSIARRAQWTRGLTWIGGSVFGLLFDWEALAPALRHRPYAYGPPSALSALAFPLGAYLLPLAVTPLANHSFGLPPRLAFMSPGACWTGSSP